MNVKNKNSKNKVYYLLFLLIFFYYYVTGETYYGESIRELTTRYFGNGKYILMSVLILNYFTINIERRKRDIITWLSYSIYPTYLAIIFVIISIQIGVFNGKYLENTEFHFINLAVFQMKIGLIGTYLLSLVIFSKNTYIYWGTLFFSIILIILVVTALFNHLILKTTKGMRNEYSKRRSLEKDEELILEKIALKEALEKREREQIEKFNKGQENKKYDLVKEGSMVVDNSTSKGQSDDSKSEANEVLERALKELKEKSKIKAPVLRIYEVEGEKKIISFKKNIEDEAQEAEEDLYTNRKLSILDENIRKNANEEVRFK